MLVGEPAPIFFNENPHVETRHAASKSRDSFLRRSSRAKPSVSEAESRDLHLEQRKSHG